VPLPFAETIKFVIEKSVIEKSVIEKFVIEKFDFREDEK
jgi:hypothetical protein